MIQLYTYMHPNSRSPAASMLSATNGQGVAGCCSGVQNSWTSDTTIPLTHTLSRVGKTEDSLSSEG